MEGSEVGRKIGKYDIVEHLGRGAMAEVYKAYHPSLDRYVAIKLLHGYLAEKTDMLARFEREAKNVAALKHTNIVQVHDFDIEESRYYMVMEFIDGTTLRDIIKEARARGEIISIDKSIRIIKDVALALEYAHKRDVVHRDVKPSNIMIDSANRVVLTDFGLAKILTGPRFTTTGALVGTPAYMSPEQCLGKQGDARSDIYSLGVVLYRLTTGLLPFFGENPLAVVFKHVNSPYTLPSKINSEIPEGLENIIVKSLEKDPDDRFHDMSEILDALYTLDSDQDTTQKDTNQTVTEDYVPPFVSTTLDEVTVSLLHVETSKTIHLEGGNEFILGRYDEDISNNPDIDLTEIDAYQHGVSRIHAVIKIDKDGTVKIVDLGSTNGTWVNGEKITSYVPLPLRNGDMIALGRLVFQTLIRV